MLVMFFSPLKLILDAGFLNIFVANLKNYIYIVQQPTEIRILILNYYA